jgi:hypothetical protein
MSLFDLFKKPNKKEPSKNTPVAPAKAGEKQRNASEKSDKDHVLSPEQQKKRYDAAMEFIKIFQEKTPLLSGKPHAGTVISVAARLAGTSLFRAINKKDVPPGVVVLSEEINQAYPQLLNLFAFYCKQNGIDVMAKPVVTEFPEQDKPLMELAQIQAEYQDQYNEIMKKHGLDYLEGARAGMIVCSIVFNYHCIPNKDIDPYVATGIVAMGIVEGAKTSPLPLKLGGPSATMDRNAKGDKVAELIRTISGTSISGSGTRLVLGETDVAIQEALDNGGKFILVHPEVANKLGQANIDIFVVYVNALIIEMETKISQIDFVNVNADDVLQEWSGRPHEQAPIYVRLMLWLKENARGYGYEQSGNSWKLRQ